MYSFVISCNVFLLCYLIFYVFAFLGGFVTHFLIAHHNHMFDYKHHVPFRNIARSISYLSYNTILPGLFRSLYGPPLSSNV